jgi:hypothetical protein
MHLADMRASTTLAFGIQATLSGTTPAKGNIVDVTDYGAATFGLITGTVTDAGAAPAGFSTKLQESDSTADASFTDVAAADYLGSTSTLDVTDDAADGIAVGMIGYIGRKKYVRAVITGTTGTAAVVAGMWFLQRPRYAPKANAAGLIAAT